MGRVKEELTDATTDEAAGAKRRRTGRRQQTHDVPVQDASLEAGSSGAPPRDAGRAGADTDSALAFVQDAQDAGPRGQAQSRAAPRRGLGQAKSGRSRNTGSARRSGWRRRVRTVAPIAARC
jgi:putative DNA primase/helicase